ncbi:MAG: hypothetical protein PHE83_17715 [Opitutaceae bacterium]|nr:hypothetical protein [Opitutaceae bacterium]
MARLFVLFLASLLGLVQAAATEIPEGELARPPSAERIAALQAEAAQADWGAVATQLRGVAVSLYERSARTAQAWYYLFRWADLFSATEAQAVANWKAAVHEAKAFYPDLAGGNRPGEPPLAPTRSGLADLWPAELRAYAMAAPDFSDQFFTLLSPLDNPARVMSILAEIWRHHPAEFKDYAGLALAIAVVDDVPPPPDWPHAQVSLQALPRKLPPPVDAFAFFVKADQAGATLQHLRRLPAADLKFVVDTGAMFDELIWAQKNVRTPLTLLAKVYDVIRYRRDRVESGTLLWPQPSYRLPDILTAGGICVDQAYFAAMVGKAWGVPTLLFRGAGLDGRHAWFGFLDGAGHWQLDCGRHAEQKYMAGFAFDPQTWTNITDHDLAFLSEGFRRLAPFKTSRMHAQFAEIYLKAGDAPSAVKAARSAVNIERRNLDAWNLLLIAQQRLGADPRAFEALLQEGALVFQRYPDIESEFKALLSRSLRARGETSAADFAERSTAHKYEASRTDLSVQQAQEILQRSLDHDDLNNRIRTYYSVLNSFGRGAGTDFFDRIVHPFVEHLLQNDRPREAAQAVERARRTLRVEANTQLEQELNALGERAQQALR